MSGLRTFLLADLPSTFHRLATLKAEGLAPSVQYDTDSGNGRRIAIRTPISYD